MFLKEQVEKKYTPLLKSYSKTENMQIEEEKYENVTKDSHNAELLSIILIELRIFY
jgi:deoxyadenosine/deoxycytidine kinase